MTITNAITFSIPSTLAIKVAVGKPLAGLPTQYETVALNVSAWTAGQFGQWLSAGLANLASERIAGAAKKSGLAGVPLIAFKRAEATAFLAGLSGAAAFPGRKLSEKPAKANKLLSLAEFAEMIRATIDAETLGLDAVAYENALPGMAKRLRDKRILAMGGNPETFDAGPDESTAGNDATGESLETAPDESPEESLPEALADAETLPDSLPDAPITARASGRNRAR